MSREIECADCWQQDGKHVPAVTVLTQSGFRPLEEAVQPFRGLCARHARRWGRQIRKRIRRIECFSTNLYAQEQ